MTHLNRQQQPRQRSTSPQSIAMAPNLYDSSERSYAAVMSALGSQPLARSKRRRASVSSNASHTSRGAVTKPAAQPVAAAQSAHTTAPPARALHTPATTRPARTTRGSSHSVNDGGSNIVSFRVHSATSAANGFSAANLLEYSTRTCWQSFARTSETIVLALDSKALLSEIRILNKNACAVNVSVAMDDRLRSYVHVERMETLPHARDATIRIGYLPCQFVRLEFTRYSHASIAVHSVQLRGVACSDVADGSGPSLCNLLSHATENLLFGSSLRASQPFMDCLSDQRVGSREWTTQNRTHLLDERIARLEAALFTY